MIKGIRGALTKEQKAQIEQCLRDPAWRMNNLYKIKNAEGKCIPFKMNWAQRHFAENLHEFNVVLKARQLGFSTLILLYMLDAALFNSNHSCGVIAQGLAEAEDMFDNKVKFAYDNLPAFIKDSRRCISDNAKELKFNNGSSIIVGTSLRGGTFQKLHVSEYGKISAKYPEKAKEIKTGSFNTVHAGQQIFVESTAEGQGGEFYDLVRAARKLEDEKRVLSALDPKFHFYPWHLNPEYALGTADALRTVIGDAYEKYFAELRAEYGVSLTVEQQAWYVKKADLMNDDMWREFPSTADESFRASVEGSIYGRQMQLLRKAGQITRVPWEPKALVHTFWDLGSFNYTAVWFFQQVAREWRMIRFIQHSGQDLTYYADQMRSFGYSYGKHYLPHDGAFAKLSIDNRSTQQLLQGLGITPSIIVPRTASIRKDIEAHCKPALLKCWFDEQLCATGIKCLDNYKKRKNHDGIWLDEPLHDEFSDGADAFRTFAMGWREPEPPKKIVSFDLTGEVSAPCQL